MIVAGRGPLGIYGHCCKSSCPGRGLTTAPGRLISIMASAGLLEVLRHTDADRPQGRGCGVRVSRHAVRQNKSPRREPCDRHARLSMLRRCYRQAVSSFDLAHLAGTVAGDRAGVRPGTLAIWSERGRFEKGTRFKF